MKLNLTKKIIFGIVAVSLLSVLYVFWSINARISEKEEICFVDLAAKLKGTETPEIIFQKDYLTLQVLVERSLVARSQMLEVSNKLFKHKEKPLSGRDLMVLKTGTQDYLKLREKLYAIAHTYGCASEVDEASLLAYNVGPQLRLKAAMLSLGAALTLYDNYLLGSVLFEQDARLRKVINDPDMGFGLMANKLMEMTLAANSIEVRQRMRKIIKFYEDSKNQFTSLDDDVEYAYLNLLIESSPSYMYVKKIRIKDIASKKLLSYERITMDLVDELNKDGINELSRLFGNTLGLFESRKGKLYGNEEVLQKIQDALQSLDILLEKTPFRLTDKLIPGHFGHVAIWTGSKAELITLGVWQDEHVQGHADEISAVGDSSSKDEHQVIEALRSGVQLSTLQEFMNIDDFAILRPIFDDTAKDALKKEALILAFRQLGKAYDFNFDVNTTDKIVCSELAYLSFPSLDWPTNKTLGRHSISPDNVAKLAWNNVPLELILFYHDGQLVDKEIQVKTMIDLMQQD